MSPDQNAILPSFPICTYVLGHHEDGLGFGVRARAQLVRQQQERADDQPVRQQFSSAPAHSAHMVHHLKRQLLLFVWYSAIRGESSDNKTKNAKCKNKM